MNVSIHRRPTKKDTVTLYLDFYLNGKRIRENLNISLHTGKLSSDQKLQNKEKIILAERIRSKKQEELEYGSNGYIPKFKRESNFVEYFETLTKNKPRGWNSTLIHLAEYTEGKVSFKHITTEWLQDFQSYLTEHVSANTTNTYFNKIKASLNSAVRDRILLSNPAKNVSALKPGKVNRPFLTFEELQQLADTPCSDTEVKRAFIFACYTGLRLSDVKRLAWSNIEGNNFEIIVKKTGSSFRSKIHPLAQEIIGAPKNPESKLFHLPEEDWKTWKTMNDWSVRSKLSKHVSFHVSRRTFATLSLTNGEDLYTVGKLLDQKDVRNTQLYVNLVDKAKENAINRLPKIDYDVINSKK